MKILIFSNIPSPYFVEYLNELGKRADVYAVFERKKASNRDHTWEIVNAKCFQFEFLDGINYNTESAFSLRVISLIKKNRDRVIIFANPTTPTGIIGINFCKLFHIPYALQSEGGIPRNSRGFKEKLKERLIPGATLYLTGMKPEEDYFTAYGAPIQRVKQYPFASLSESDIIDIPPSEEEKDRIKKELNITYERIILYVGRMLKVKGVDVLIRACTNLEDNIGIYLVGGSETEEYAELAKRCNIGNLVFINHVQLDQLKRYYLAADLLVLPTRSDTWGLVINEAMSFGLPIITTDACVAGNQLITEGVNGFVVKSEDFIQMHEKIEQVMADPGLRREMANNNVSKIRPYTYENMAKVIYEYLISTFSKANDEM